MKSRLRQAISSTLIVSVLSMGLPVPAQAGIVRTEAAADRERIAAVLEREEVRTRLAAYGVGPAEAKARVAALTDEEAGRLAAEMDALPAGAGGGDFVIYAFLALLLLPFVLIGAFFYVIVKSLDAGRSGASVGGESGGDTAPKPAQY